VGTDAGAPSPWNPESIPTRTIDDVRVVAEGFEFPEGPVELPDGSIVVTEIEGARISRVDTDGSVDLVAACDGGPNGAALGPDGALYVCNNGGRFARGGYTGGWIERVDLDSGRVEVIFTECDGRRLSGPNDIVFDASGGFWFTDTGKFRGRVRDVGSVYYVAAGSDRPVEVIHPAETPNGIGLSPDGTTLYYAETTTARLRRRAITAPGEVADAGAHDIETLVCGLPGDQLFDSIALDRDGRICIGTLLAGCVTEVSADGAQVVRCRLPDEFADRLVTNLCFGGADRTTAYITVAETKRLLACRWPTPGLELNHTATTR
jgi:gluconolactonase